MEKHQAQPSASTISQQQHLVSQTSLVNFGILSDIV